MRKTGNIYDGKPYTLRLNMPETMAARVFEASRFTCETRTGFIRRAIAAALESFEQAKAVR